MAFIRGVFSAFPRSTLNEEQLFKLFEHESFGYDAAKLGRIKRIISSVNVQSRPSCVDFDQFYQDLDKGKCPCTVERPSGDNLFRGAKVPFKPTITERALVWEKAVKELALRAAKGLVEKTSTDIAEIDCVITNTSTGVILPNLSTWLPQKLGLKNLKSHYSLDNTGCGGAITCLDLARSAVLSGRASCVLIVTVDCCTPHINTYLDLDMEAILPNLLFGDGAAAALVTGREEQGSWRVEEPDSLLLGEETSQFINMKMTEHGYYLNLAKELVPGLHATVSSKWQDILKTNCTSTSNPQDIEWVVHPGGKGILEVFKQQIPPLSDHDLRHSLTVMREKGNLVSATLLFVLELMLDQHDKDRACLVGPGPGIELKLLVIEKVR